MRVRKTSKSTILVTGEYKLEMKLLKEIGDFTAGYLNLGEMVKAIHK
jgi:hypothetical protein